MFILIMSETKPNYVKVNLILYKKKQHNVEAGKALLGQYLKILILTRRKDRVLNLQSL